MGKSLKHHIIRFHLHYAISAGVAIIAVMAETEKDLTLCGIIASVLLAPAMDTLFERLGEAAERDSKRHHNHKGAK